MTSSFLPIHAPLNVTPGLRLGPCSSNSSRTFSLFPGLSWNSTKNFIIHLGLDARERLRLIDDRCCGPNIGARAIGILRKVVAEQPRQLASRGIVTRLFPPGVPRSQN